MIYNALLRALLFFIHTSGKLSTETMSLIYDFGYSKNHSETWEDKGFFFHPFPMDGKRRPEDAYQQLKIFRFNSFNYG